MPLRPHRRRHIHLPRRNRILSSPAIMLLRHKTKRSQVLTKQSATGFPQRLGSTTLSPYFLFTSYLYILPTSRNLCLLLHDTWIRIDFLRFFLKPQAQCSGL